MCLEWARESGLKLHSGVYDPMRLVRLGGAVVGVNAATQQRERIVAYHFRHILSTSVSFSIKEARCGLDRVLCHSSTTCDGMLIQ